MTRYGRQSMRVTLILSLVLLLAVPAAASDDSSDELPNFTGQERPGLLMLDGLGVFRYLKTGTRSEKVRAFNKIGEDFLDLETALLPSAIAAEKPQMTEPLIRAMDGWKNEYQRPWSVASYGGPLTLKSQLRHTLRINIGLTLYHPSFGYSSQRLEEIVYRLKGSDPKYLPCVRSSGAGGDYLVTHEINLGGGEAGLRGLLHGVVPPACERVGGDGLGVGGRVNLRLVPFAIL